MGYVTDYQEKAQECSDRAQEELPKEPKEERKEQEIRRQQALEHKEESKEFEKKIQENNNPDNPETDSVTISEEGKVSLKNDSQTEETAATVEPTDVKMYTSEGSAVFVDPDVEPDNKNIDIKI